MSKRNFLTVVGITLSLAIAIGGWFLTSTLIEIKSNSLLSASYSVDTNKLYNIPVSMTSKIPYGTSDEFPLARSNLTEDDIVSILQNWDAVGRETPHEPTEEQLNMEQAIETGKKWLSFIDELNIFPDELLHFNNPRAYLFQNLPIGQVGQFLPPTYSYWNVTFTNDSMSINMVINAVTGQVWKTEISMYRFDIEINDNSIANTLTAFVSTLEINCVESSESNDSAVTWVTNKDAKTNSHIDVKDVLISKGMLTSEFESLIGSQSFADDNAYAAVIITGWHFEDDHWIIDNFIMQLTDRK